MFGGGAGHIADMIARLKANKALLRKKSYFKTMQAYKYSSNVKTLKIKPIVLKTDAEIRKEMHDLKTNDYKRIFISIMAAFLLLFILGIVVSLFWSRGLEEFIYRALGEGVD